MSTFFRQSMAPPFFKFETSPQTPVLDGTSHSANVGTCQKRQNSAVAGPRGGERHHVGNAAAQPRLKDFRDANKAGAVRLCTSFPLKSPPKNIVVLSAPCVPCVERNQMSNRHMSRIEHDPTHRKQRTYSTLLQDPSVQLS